ncbi:NADH:flavin oxidoreductase/NADH oxidase [Arthrobacter sp. Helios]|uniref:NADH:flavin oxidoreductase/NADH oxidase n=1 Tax=Arthrobacter sp. Helios TaxID=2828862 RepID=UPI0020509165|nr:NADH:flavin oxidoreductase/NADH oxidase [Arthrobacter sp. Helios]UPO76308.1 NADH:flavin oxidoreductase/NADH oxidase [Arthrobacter sp. Helios]
METLAVTNVFDPIQIRDVEIPNRVWMSPMCTYTAAPQPELAGRPNDFHYAHYTTRAAGGVGLVLVEATGVVPEGRISPYDLGLWNDDQAAGFARLTRGIRDNGAVPGIQLAHAGRKASVDRPWKGGELIAEDSQADGGENHGWQPVGPSALAFPGLAVPHELTREEIAGVVAAFADAARRADTAGFDVVEIHAAHGYLLHSFLSPVANRRTDGYGGTLENRARIVLETIDAVRDVWPANKPVFMRVSTTDWVEENPGDTRESWTLSQTVQLAKWAAEHGVDLIDASSGGLDVVPIPRDQDYQTRNAAVVRSETGVLTAAVGRVDSAQLAEELVTSGKADAVFLGRPLLRNPSWANDAALELGTKPRFIEQYAYTL